MTKGVGVGVGVGQAEILAKDKRGTCLFCALLLESECNCHKSKSFVIKIFLISVDLGHTVEGLGTSFLIERINLSSTVRSMEAYCTDNNYVVYCLFRRHTLHCA
jgi:hypothetical protein